VRCPSSASLHRDSSLTMSVYKSGAIIGECWTIVKRGESRYTTLHIRHIHSVHLLLEMTFLYDMRIYPLKLYVKKKQNILFFVSSLLLNIAAWVWLLVNIRPSVGQVFLHYNILFGVDLVGSWYNVLSLPIAGFLIILLNALLGWFLFKQDEFAAYLLNAIAVLVNMFLLVSSALLVFLNV